jgi:hypothetical protein
VPETRKIELLEDHEERSAVVTRMPGAIDR